MNELSREIEAEKEQILETLMALEDAMKRDQKTTIELAAMATFIQNVYNGMENILKRVLKHEGVTLPPSEFWHKDLLSAGVDNQIISLKLLKRLDVYRTFRHFFIHGYGIMIDKEKLIPLATGISDLWKDFESEIDIFMRPSESKPY